MFSRRALFCIIPIALGVGLIVAGAAIPVYTDFEAARALKLNACSLEAGQSGSRVVEGWYDQMQALKTLRYPLMQGGISLILATLTVLGLSWAFGAPDTGRLRTPRRKWLFFALGSGVVVLSWGSQIHGLMLDASRGEFPWCADTIVIPMMGLSIMYPLMLAVLLAIGGIVSEFFETLPVDLGVWQSDRPVLSWVVTAALGLPTVLIAVVAVSEATASAFLGTPAAVVAIYLLLATRAALLAER